MNDKPDLSDGGKQRRDRILQAAVEEGHRLRKRRESIRRGSACAIAGLVLLATAVYVSQQSRHERSVVRDEAEAVEPNTGTEEPSYSSIRVELVSSDSVSIENYLVRTADVSITAVILDDRELVEALEDTDFGIARAGRSTWLSRDDGTMIRTN